MDRDFKYIMQDTCCIYLGSRFRYEELLEEELLAFKLKTIIYRYILKEVDASATLESHFYYMAREDFSYKTYCELKAKVKVSIPVQKKSLTGRVKSSYQDRVYTLKDFAALDPAGKRQLGLMVREIIISKLGLLTFTV